MSGVSTTTRNQAGGKLKKPERKARALGVADGTRTRDTQDHNLVLYQLNYSHHRCVKATKYRLTHAA